MSKTLEQWKRRLSRNPESSKEREKGAGTESAVDVSPSRAGSRASVMHHSFPATSLNNGLRQLNLSNPSNAKFVNFATPNNDEFYSRNPYFPLDSNRREIRLLKVLPRSRSAAQTAPNVGRPGDMVFTKKGSEVVSYRRNERNMTPERTPLVCSLMDQVPLSSVAGQYIALSYCAGSPVNTIPILVNGVRFNAFANLAHALESTVQAWERNLPRDTAAAAAAADEGFLVWADQVCINQSDHEERSEQVGLMREIYRRSEEVYVCLSTSVHQVGCLCPSCPTRREGSAYNVHRLAPKSAQRLQPSPVAVYGQPEKDRRPVQRRTSFENTYKAVSDPGWTAFTWIQECEREPPDPDAPELGGSVYEVEDVATSIGRTFKRHLSNPTRCGNFPEKLLVGLQMLAGSPWWQRAWVFQEFMIAPRATFLYDNESISWSTLSKSLGLVFSGEVWRFVDSLERTLQQFMVDEQERQFARQRQDMKKPMESLQARRKEAEETLNNKYAEVQGMHVPPQPAGAEVSALEAKLNLLNSEWRDMKASYHAIGKNPLTPPPLSIKKHLKQLDFAVVQSVTSCKAESPQRWKDLKSVLQHSRNCLSSDPRDRVYAFLGLASAEYAVPVDYSETNTIIHVLIEAARRIVLYERGLGILTHASGGRQRLGCFLPSWVPDWTSRRSRTASELERYVQHITQTGDGIVELAPLRLTLNTSGNPKPNQIPFAEFAASGRNSVTPDMMAVRCAPLDVLDELQDDIPGFPELRSFLTADGARRVVTLKTALVDDEMFFLEGARWPVILRSEGDVQMKDKYGFICEAVILEGSAKFRPETFKRDPMKVWLV